MRANRIIKFRAWDKDESRMYYNVLVASSGNFIGLQYEQECDDDGHPDCDIEILSASYDNKKYEVAELMQFTGIHDKTGQEVYESDIIQDCLTKVKYEVRFGFCKRLGFTGWYGYSHDLETVTAINTDYDDDVNSNIEVVGNIYETNLLTPQTR